jgi:hypothetical protein
MPRSSVLLAVLVVILVGLPAPGRPALLASHDATPRAGEERVVGTWRVVVNDASGLTHPGTVTFAADGTLLVSIPPVLPAPEGAPVAQFEYSAGNGVWASTGERAVAFTFDLLATDDVGTPLGVFTVRGTLDLTEKGDGYDGSYDVVVTDPSGQVSPAGGGTITGTRMMLEPIGTPSAAA